MKKLLVSALLLSASGLANANLVQNGSFEADIQANGTWGVYGSLAGGWTSVSGAGIELRNNVFGTASNGVNFVELDSHNNSAMQQIITTSVGSFYNLAFDYSPRVNQPASTNGISVFWNDVLLGDFTAIGGNANLWTVKQFLVKGTGSDILKFAATGTSNSLGGNIDNVSLTPSAVPLPAALPLMLSAMGVLGFASRRKKETV